MKRLLQIYIYGQWHIAFCAAALYLGSSVAYGSIVHWPSAFHVFGATLFIYLMHRIYSGRTGEFENVKRYSFLNQHLTHAQLTAGFGALIALLSFWILPTYTKLILALCGFISLAYILPLIFKRRIRDIGLIKIFAISFTWACIPLLTIWPELDLSILLLIFIENFCFIYALTIPFDVRDMHLDQRSRVSNLATIFQFRELKIFIIILLSICCVFTFLLHNTGLISLFTVLLLFTLYVMQYLFTKDLDKERSEGHFLFFLDGFILIKGVVLYSSSL